MATGTPHARAASAGSPGAQRARRSAQHEADIERLAHELGTPDAPRRRALRATQSARRPGEGGGPVSTPRTQSHSHSLAGLRTEAPSALSLHSPSVAARAWRVARSSSRRAVSDTFERHADLGGEYMYDGDTSAGTMDEAAVGLGVVRACGVERATATPNGSVRAPRLALGIPAQATPEPQPRRMCSGDTEPGASAHTRNLCQAMEQLQRNMCEAQEIGTAGPHANALAEHMDSVAQTAATLNEGLRRTIHSTLEVHMSLALQAHGPERDPLVDQLGAGLSELLKYSDDNIRALTDAVIDLALQERACVRRTRVGGAAASAAYGAWGEGDRVAYGARGGAGSATHGVGGGAVSATDAAGGSAGRIGARARTFGSAQMHRTARDARAVEPALAKTPWSRTPLPANPSLRTPLSARSAPLPGRVTSDAAPPRSAASQRIRTGGETPPRTDTTWGTVGDTPSPRADAIVGAPWTLASAPSRSASHVAAGAGEGKGGEGGREGV
ncbi:hypothetical protein MSPP1_001563 [Malassezia sp. CBS 17886]|nr:hypothetical protein MSPP1_001563 [Malassezia sp. CBS 17886]